MTPYDDKLDLFTSMDTLKMTMESANDKRIPPSVVKWFTEPAQRAEIVATMELDEYRIAPPHIVLIPKPDSNEMRKVYCNEPLDRVICTQIGNVYQQMFGDRIHPACVSYQKGIGVGKIVKEISAYLMERPGLKGAKFDIAKYFDNISEETRDAALRELDTGSCIDRIVWDYLHDEHVIDENGSLIRAYKGIAQGFSLAAFLANYLLRDIDEEISRLDVLYYRYSDDILILGPDFKKARDILYARLQPKGLTINPKKVTAIDASTPFTFLGFKINGESITFSDDKIRRFKKKVRAITKTRKGQPLRSEDVLRRAIREINKEFYVPFMSKDRDFSWASCMFSTVNVEEDIRMLDFYVKDHLRHVFTGKWNATGNANKVSNEMLERCGYVSMMHLYKLYKIARPLFQNEVRMKIA